MAKGKFNIMDSLFTTVLFSALIGTIAASVTSAAANLSGGAAVLVGLTTLFIAIAFIRSIVPSKGR